jgi:hypothetical protein
LQNDLTKADGTCLRGGIGIVIGLILVLTILFDVYFPYHLGKGYCFYYFL